MSLSDIFSFIWNLDLLLVAGVIIGFVILTIVLTVIGGIFGLASDGYVSFMTRNPKIKKFIDRTIGVIGLFAIVSVAGGIIFVIISSLFN
jgi:threonine/homoserine/homoserine lactone efflux protein